MKETTVFNRGRMILNLFSQAVDGVVALVLRAFKRGAVTLSPSKDELNQIAQKQRAAGSKRSKQTVPANVCAAGAVDDEF